MGTHRFALAGVVAIALAAAGCGSNGAANQATTATSRAEQAKSTAAQAATTAVEKTSTALTAQAAALEQKAQDLQKQVAAGKLTAQQAAGQLRDDATSLAGQAKTAANQALQQAENSGGLSADQKRQLENARKQLESALGGG